MTVMRCRQTHRHVMRPMRLPAARTADGTYAHGHKEVWAMPVPHQTKPIAMSRNYLQKADVIIINVYKYQIKGQMRGDAAIAPPPFVQCGRQLVKNDSVVGTLFFLLVKNQRSNVRRKPISGVIYISFLSIICELQQRQGRYVFSNS